LRGKNSKKGEWNILYFRTCKIDRYESTPTYAFGHIFRRSIASVGGAACAGTAAVYCDTGHCSHQRSGLFQPYFHRIAWMVR
jgi:hypothetical protein